MQIHLKLPAPHSKEQGQIIRIFQTSQLLEMWVACGTKYGKTLGGAEAFASILPIKNQGMYRWVAPTFSQSQIGSRYIQRMLPPEPYVTQTIHGIKVHGPDSMLEFRSGDIPENLEGEAVHGYVLDECAKLKEQVYASAKTTVTMTRGPMLMISTPRGKNWFYRKCMEAKDHMEWSIRNGKIPEKVFITAKTAMNPKVPRSAIEDAKRSLPERLYRQYYEAEFVEEGSVFGFLNEAFEGALDFSSDDVHYLSSHDSTCLYVGADWAKLEDYTVFTILNEKGRQVGLKRLQKRSYPLQVKELWEFISLVASKSSSPRVITEILHDKTGVGEAIDDIINTSNPGHNVTGIVWNNTNKELFVNDLILSLEQTQIKLLPIQVVKDELTSFEVIAGIGGRFRYSAPEGMHDDTVMSLVLANSLFRENKGRNLTVVTMNSIDDLVKRNMLHGGFIDYD